MWQAVDLAGFTVGSVEPIFDGIGPVWLAGRHNGRPVLARATVDVQESVAVANLSPLPGHFRWPGDIRTIRRGEEYNLALCGDATLVAFDGSAQEVLDVPDDESGKQPTRLWLSGEEDTHRIVAAYPHGDVHELRLLDWVRRRLLTHNNDLFVHGPLDPVVVATGSATVAVGGVLGTREEGTLSTWASPSFWDPDSDDEYEQSGSWAPLSAPRADRITDALDWDGVGFLAGVSGGQPAVWGGYDDYTVVWSREGSLTYRDTRDRLAIYAEPTRSAPATSVLLPSRPHFDEDESPSLLIGRDDHWVFAQGGQEYPLPPGLPTSCLQTHAQGHVLLLVTIGGVLWCAPVPL